MAQKAKSSLAMQETQVQSLRQEDPLEEEMATHSSILAWKNSMDRGVWQATVHGVIKNLTRLTDGTHTHVHIHSRLNIKIFIRPKYYRQVSSCPCKSKISKTISLSQQNHEGLHLYNKNEIPDCWIEHCRDQMG